MGQNFYCCDYVIEYVVYDFHVCPVFPALLIEGAIFSPLLYSYCLCQRYGISRCVGLSLGFLTCSCDLYFCFVFFFFCQCQTVFCSFVCLGVFNISTQIVKFCSNSVKNNISNLIQIALICKLLWIV